MIIIARSSHFEREYRKYVRNNLARADDLIKALQLFVTNPAHPSLKVEKLAGSNIWSLRLTKGDRLFFLWADPRTALLLDVGPHDKYRLR